MKNTLLALTVGALAATTAATGANASTVLFNLGSSTNDLGTSQSYTVSGLTIVATGYDASHDLTDLWGKNDGGDEVGLGLENDPTGEHEIHYGSGFVQLDLSGLVGKVKDGTTFFSTNSTTEGEKWGVFGSDKAGSYKLKNLLVSGKVETVEPLPDLGMFKYYDFVELSHPRGQGDNFLIHDISTTAVPEPATWAMMLVGFGGICAMIRGKRRKPATAAA